MNTLNLLQQAIKLNASDIHITVGSPVIFRVNGALVRIGDVKLFPEDTQKLCENVLTEEQMEKLKNSGEVDLSISQAGLGRFRINAYKQRGVYGMALRVVSGRIPSMQELRLPKAIEGLCGKKRGLILVTGPTGSGKSTTLASMVDHMNTHRNDHIITIEDPVEYMHRHNKSVINQREIGNDSMSFANALRAALRQDPDTILVGEMRDLETIATAITAAETGHLVMSTLHTIGSAKTVDRVIDVFPPHQQQQVRVQLASVVEAVISQQILPKSDGKGRVAAFEVMIATPAVRNLIREGKTHQIQTLVQTGSKFGMQTMDDSLLELYRERYITKEVLLRYAMDEPAVSKQLALEVI